jgi:hypothetical protein
MGESAATEMRRVNRHPGGTTSWLHGSAPYHHGDPVGGTPQRRTNLFAGTQNTNMEHLRYENTVSGHGDHASNSNSRPYASAIDYHGTPLTQIGLSGRVPNSNNVYNQADYSVLSPYDPMGATRFSRPLDPFDPRSVGDRERAGSLPSTHDVRRDADFAYAHQVMSALPEEEEPEEYRRHRRRHHRHHRRRS